MGGLFHCAAGAERGDAPGTGMRAAARRAPCGAPPGVQQRPASRPKYNTKLTKSRRVSRTGMSRNSSPASLCTQLTKAKNGEGGDRHVARPVC